MVFNLKKERQELEDVDKEVNLPKIAEEIRCVDENT